MSEPAVILAGGRGTRLGHLTAEVPKPLIEIGDRPVLFHQLDQLAEQGFDQVLMLIGHLGEQIRARCGNGSRWGLSIEYLQEDQPRGTGGALLGLQGKLDGPFVLLSGDIMCRFDFRALVDAHRHHRQADPATLGTLVVQADQYMSECDLVEMDLAKRIQALHLRPHDPNRGYENLTIASVYMLETGIFRYIQPHIRQELERDIFSSALAAGESFYGFRNPGYLRDMGSPERLEQVQQEFYD